MPAAAGAMESPPMTTKTYTRAAVWTDHHQAEVSRFDADDSETQKLRAHSHTTGQHGSAVRTEHEFMAEVCNQIETVAQVLVLGSHTVLSDFKHYVEKHRPQAGKHIAGYEVVGTLTEPQRVAQARKFFSDLERLAPHA
jgi:stalled ribosome rescue protein Dom34